MLVVKNLLKRSWAAGLILSRVALGLLLQKIIAIKYGPVGTTYLSHFQNFIALITQPLQDVIGQGLINGIRQKKIQEKELTSSALLFSLFLVLSIFSLLLISQHITLSTLDFLNRYWILLFIALLFIALQLILMNYLVAKGEIKALFFLNSIPGAITLIVLYNLSHSLIIILMSYLGMQAITTICYVGFTIMRYPNLYSFSAKISPTVKKHFLNFLAIGLTIWLSSKLTSFYVRAYAIDHFPTADTGHWQAIERISDAYKGLFLSFLMISLFPVLSDRLKTKSLALFFKKYLLQYSLVVISFAVGLLLFKEIILTTLYDENYSIASSLFNWQIYGDIFALTSFPFALLLLAKIDTKKYIVAELIGTFGYLAAIYMIPEKAIQVLFYSYFIRYLIYLSLTMVFTRKYWRHV
ncbi:MAG: PST family polysaccharide transporter [Marivirga sp.]|jgi:PST family polysaccharide transporter